MLEELDLFGYRDIILDGKSTNAFLACLERCQTAQANFSLTVGFINARALLRKSNRFEI